VIEGRPTKVHDDHAQIREVHDRVLQQQGIAQLHAKLGSHQALWVRPIPATVKEDGQAQSLTYRVVRKQQRRIQGLTGLGKSEFAHLPVRAETGAGARPNRSGREAWR
jgi:hypothetical protein